MSLAAFTPLAPASAIFNVEDAYARELGIAGPFPPAIGPMRFLALAWTEAGGGRTRRFEPPYLLVVTRNVDGYLLFFNEVRLPRGGPRQPYFGRGRLRLRVESAYYQPVELEVPLPSSDDAIDVELAPGYLYPFTQGVMPKGRRAPTLLYGSLLTAGGDGVAGATVEAFDSLDEPVARFSCTTDRTGRWVLVFRRDFPPLNGRGAAADEAMRRAPAILRFALPDQPAPIQTELTIEAGKTNSLPLTGFSGQVLRRTAGGDTIPVEGARIEVKGADLRTLGETPVPSGRGGVWFFYFLPDQPAERVTVTARMPGAEDSRRAEITPRKTVALAPFVFAPGGAGP